MLRYDAGEVITAMVTPMNEAREIDYNLAVKLAKYLSENGSDAVLLAGTTGESPTLTFEEEVEILHSVNSALGKSLKIILGAGSNSTETAVKAAKNARHAGVNAILSVVPYYNKPSQKGLIEHFSAIAKSVDLPIILYNIPGRTGINMQPDTVAYLAKNFDNIVALKQSYPDMDILSELRDKCPDDFALYSGDDSLTLPMLALGCHGVISVASHVIGKEVKKMIRLFKSAKTQEALELHLKLMPLFKKLFMAPNPVPVKYALSYINIIKDYVRKPLVELSEDEKAEFLKVFKNYV